MPLCLGHRYQAVEFAEAGEQEVLSTANAQSTKIYRYTANSTVFFRKTDHPTPHSPLSHTHLPS